MTGAAQSQALLRSARATMEQLKAAELRDYFRNECVAELEAMLAIRAIRATR